MIHYRTEANLRYSPFYNIHPLGQVLYYFALVLFILFFQHPIYLAVSFVTVLFLGLRYSFPRKVFASFRFYLLIGIVIVVFNMFMNHRGRHILFYFFGNSITLEAVVYGIMMAFSLICVFLMFVSFQKIISQDKILFVFSKLSAQMAMILMLSIRWVPYFKKVASDIQSVQMMKSRNTALLTEPIAEPDTHTSTRKQNKRIRARKMQAGAHALNILISYSLENFMTTAESMKARGYTGSRKRTFYFHYQLKRTDVLFLAVLCTFIGCNIYFYVQGYGVCDIFRNLSVQHLFTIVPEAFAAYVLFCLLPFFTEIRWRKGSSVIYDSSTN